MTNNSTKHILRASLSLVLFLMVGLALVAYLVSPLRDPSFIPDAVNAGATVRWLKPERYWTIAIRVLSVALATNVALLIWAKNQWQIVRRPVTTTFKYLGLGILWIFIFYGSWYLLMLLILTLYIAD